MINVKPSGEILGARVEGLDLSQPLSPQEFALIARALGEHGVLCFPEQRLQPPALKAFSAQFGTLEVNVAARWYQEADLPEVMILSNIVENGHPIGLPDAGQDWHTDMSYRDVMGFVNVLYGIRIPRRHGVPLGGTEFSNMHAVYDALPADIRTRLADATATHNFEKFWEHMRRNRASERPPQ